MTTRHLLRVFVLITTSPSPLLLPFLVLSPCPVTRGTSIYLLCYFFYHLPYSPPSLLPSLTSSHLLLPPFTSSHLSLPLPPYVSQFHSVKTQGMLNAKFSLDHKYLAVQFGIADIVCSHFILLFHLVFLCLLYHFLYINDI